MDSDLISATIERVSHQLRQTPLSDCTASLSLAESGTQLHPRLWLYTLTSQNCLFVLSEVAEMGVRQVSQDFLESLLASIATNQSEPSIHALFQDTLWPAMRHGLLIKNESFRYSFIALVKCVIANFSTSDRFKDIAPLAATVTAASDSDQMNFFDNMLSLTTAFNSRGLRQLVRFLGHSAVSPANLREVLLPLVLHRIELISGSYDARNRSALTHAQRESLGSSFEALSAVARQLPMQAYENLVSEHMNKLDKGLNVELVLKTLIGLLNGYSCDGGDNHAFMVAVLHRLEKHLGKRVASDVRHKKAQKSVTAVDLMDQRNAEWTLRGMALQVPVAMAIMNIAVKLPRKHLKEIITKVVLRICDFLKAKEPETRKEAGTTLLRIIETVNAGESGGDVRYLAFVTHTVKTHLDRGFQRHVALSTSHRVLQGLHDKQVFLRLSLDRATMRAMVELYLDELFGDMAKEKAERATAEKGIVPEAKKVKAFEGFRLLGNVLDRSLLLEFFQLVVAACKEARSQAALQKMQTVLEGLQSKGGLVKNARLDAVSLFTLARVLIGDHIDSLFLAEGQTRGSGRQDKGGKTSSGMEDMHLYARPQRLDGHDATQASVASNGAGRSSAHLVVNCGLSLLHGLCKAYHGAGDGVDLVAMLAPLVDAVTRILRDVRQRAVLHSAVKCLKEIVRVNPPSLAGRVAELRDLLFAIHGRNSASSDARDTQGEALATLFNKTIAQFLQRADVELTQGQHQLLLLGVQVDSLNGKRQMTSFQLLRAIIESRIRRPIGGDSDVIRLTGEKQIAEIIEKVKTIALLSPYERTRADARLTVATFVRNCRQTRQYLQETILFLLKQLAIGEDGALSACLMMGNLFREYSPMEIDAGAVSAYVVAFGVMAMQEGVTEKVELVLGALVKQVMHAVDVDKQNGLCEMVHGYTRKYELDSRKFRIALSLLAEMLPVLQDDARAALAVKLVDGLVEKLPALIGLGEKLDKQLAASRGQDADLMEYLEKVDAKDGKKRRLDVAESEEEKEDEEDPEEEKEDGKMDKSEELPDKIKNVMENINGCLQFLATLLAMPDNDNQASATVLLHLVRTAGDKKLWHTVIRKLVSHRHNAIRLTASGSVIQKILSLQLAFDNDTVSSITDCDMAIKIVTASFNQLKNEQIPLEECNAVLVNLLLVWQIVVGRFGGEEKADLCKRIVDGANFVAKQELLENKSLMRRCAVLKMLVGVCTKTTAEQIEEMRLERSVLYMWLREERQAQDESSANKKKNAKRHYKTIDRYCSAAEILEWKGLVVNVGEVIRKALGEEKCKRLTVTIGKDRAANKLKRINEESALAISNPGEALAKKQRRSRK